MENHESGMIFNILIKEDDGMFVAHCLELDIVATAESVEQAQKDIIALICAQVDYAFSNDNLENLYCPAPAEVWQEFWSAENSGGRDIRLKIPSKPEPEISLDFC